MDTKHNFDELFESAMRQDPHYGLPKGFAEGIAERIARRLAFKVQLRNLWRYAVVLAAFTLVMFLADYLVPLYLPRYEWLTINGYLVAAIAFLILFVIFMDKVVLGYLESRK